MINPDDHADGARLFLCGDVMTGRGIDQILPFPADPKLCEPSVDSALCYVELAEAVHGRISRPVEFSYIWGEALASFARLNPAARIVNLETSVTARGTCLPKGINYRMNPKNLLCLTAAGIDCCVLANNHVLDWGYDGLEDTLTALTDSGILTAGAGRDDREASRPAIIERNGQSRIIIFGLGLSSSGIPDDWRATARKAGVNLASDLSHEMVDALAAQVRSVKRRGDIVIVSIHWGGNWGYEVPASHVRFAHALIDRAGVDIVHGHSSHHPKGLEVYNGRLVLYGCGDFINDYEGIGGYEAFRGDLTIGYFPRLWSSGQLAELRLTPFRIKRFRLEPAGREEAAWLADVLSREGARFHTRVLPAEDGDLLVEWS